MNLIDLDAIRLAQDKQPYDGIVAELKEKFHESIFTDQTDDKGAPVYRDLITIYARLVTLQDACEQFLNEHKQDIHNAVYQQHPNEAAKGLAFTHDGGRFVLRTRSIYNFLPFDPSELTIAKNGSTIRRKPLKLLYEQRDQLTEQLHLLKEQIKDREQQILRENAKRIKPIQITQNLAYI